jgi:hypothetical protein
LFSAININPTSIHPWVPYCGVTSEFKTSFENVLRFVQLQEVFLHTMCFYHFLPSVTPHFSFPLHFIAFLLFLLLSIILIYLSFLDSFHLFLCYSSLLAVVFFPLLSISIYPHSRV